MFRNVKLFYFNLKRAPFTSKFSIFSFLKRKQDFDIEEDHEYEELVSNHFGSSTDHCCYIIHPYIKWGPNKTLLTNPQQQLEEAEALIRTLPTWKIYDKIAVPVESLSKKTIFGSGALKKLQIQIRQENSITAVFLNLEMLKNVQLEELQKIFGVTIFDRYKIVMQILHLHATSKHSKLQVQLGEISYLWSRLKKFDTPVTPSGIWETRRLVLQNREKKLRAAIEKLRVQREQSRSRRKKMNYPAVAVVGYTNSGKTSLIKALTEKKDLHPRNQLFATLDVTVHAGFLPSNLEVLYVDTVGFISDIPTSLIECFVATLEDAMFADVIIHVEDISSKAVLHQRKHVISTLENLVKKIGNDELLKKIITVGNKFDIIKGDIDYSGLLKVSAKTGYGIDELKKKVEEAVLAATDRLTITIKVATGGDESRWLYKNATVVSVDQEQGDFNFQNIQVIITKGKFNQFKHYFIENK